MWALRKDWRQRALCGSSPAPFFPQHRPSVDAFEMCAACPVRRECLEMVLDSPWEPSGIWAGLSAQEVKRLWRERHPRQRRAEALELMGLA